MPKRKDIKKILVIGAGPIIIGPAPITKIFLMSFLFGIFFYVFNKITK